MLGAVAQRELQAAQPPPGSSRSDVSKRTAPTVILAAVPTYTRTTLCPPSGVPCPYQGGRLTCSPCPQLRSEVSEPHSSGSGPVDPSSRFSSQRLKDKCKSDVEPACKGGEDDHNKTSLLENKATDAAVRTHAARPRSPISCSCPRGEPLLTPQVVVLLSGEV